MSAAVTRVRRPLAHRRSGGEAAHGDAVDRLQLGADPVEGDRGHRTGSVAILTDAVHSSIDLIASIVAYFSIRKAGEPADDSHRYGHEKLENIAAAIEGILVLFGSAAITFEAIRRLVGHGTVRTLGLGIAVTASRRSRTCWSRRTSRAARTNGLRALAADATHLRTDASRPALCCSG